MSSLVWNASNLQAGFNLDEGCIAGINLKVEAGERVALLGGERSGTYMLLRVLCGLRPRRGGDLSAFGETVAELRYYDDWDHIFSRALRARFGVALEKDGLVANVSLREGLETVLRFGSQVVGNKGLNHKERASAVLQLFGIESMAKLRPHQLSSGERRFAALARAALLDPEVYVLEGPTKNLDDRDRERLIFACDQMFLANPTKSLLMATEDWAFAMRYCSRAVVMQDGKIIFDGAWNEMPAMCPAYWSKIADSVKRRWELDAPLREVI